MNPTPRLICSLFTATALAACFPPVENAADVGDDDVEVKDSSGLETTSGGDTTTQDSTPPDTAAPDCSDLDRVCARGVSTPFGYCEQLLLHGDPCDDGNPCTAEDSCDTGTCEGSPVDCDDGVECSTEVCSVDAGGCVYDATACPCAADADCADGKPCTSDVCDPTSWTCVNDIAPGNSCNDFDPCTIDDVCGAAGNCAGEPKPCDDSNVCTSDSCDPLSGMCKFVALPQGPCEDGDTCSISDRCVDGACVSGHLASFREDYPAWFGEFTRVFFTPAQLEDGSYLLVDRVYCDGPCFSGLQLLHLTSSGVGLSQQEWDRGAQGIPKKAPVGAYSPEPWLAQSVGLVVAEGAAYVLDNQSYITRVDLASFTRSWAVAYSSDIGGVARGIERIGTSVFLLGSAPTEEDGAVGMWLGSVSPSDGTIASSHSPVGGDGLSAMFASPIAGGAIVSGTVASTGTEEDVFVARLDTEMEILWSVVYAAPFEQIPVALVANSDGIAVFAKTPDPVEGSDQLVVVRVDYGGTVTGTVMPSAASFTATGAVVTPAGGFLVVGSRPQDLGVGIWNARSHALWLDSEAELIGEYDGSQTDAGFTGVQRTDFGYVLTGSTGMPSATSGGVLMVTDFELNTPCDPTP